MTQVTKLTLARATTALNKATKKLGEFENTKKQLEIANSSIKELKGIDKELQKVLDDLNLQISDYRESLIDCSEANSKFKKDNRILINKINTAWQIMGKLTEG